MKYGVRFCSLLSMVIGACLAVPFDRAVAQTSGTAAEKMNELLKERLTFTIKKLGVTLGHAVMSIRSCPEHIAAPGHWCVDVLITSVSLRDHEFIVLGAGDFLPRRVIRRVDVFGRREDIVETYDQTSGEVDIVKTIDRERTQRTTLKKNPPIENVYGFLYRLRASNGRLAPGRAFVLRLPLVDVTLTVTDHREIRLMGRRRTVFELKDTEDRYRFWVEDDATKRPWRIDGPSPLGMISMRLKEIDILNEP